MSFKSWITATRWQHIPWLSVSTWSARRALAMRRGSGMRRQLPSSELASCASEKHLPPVLHSKMLLQVAHYGRIGCHRHMIRNRCGGNRAAGPDGWPQRSDTNHVRRPQKTLAELNHTVGQPQALKQCRAVQTHVVRFQALG